MKRRKSIITNEEKAAQIEDEYTFEARVGAMEMAEWKDQQFKDYLNKKLNEVQEKMTNCALNESIHIARHYGYVEKVIKDILKEFFNEK